MAYWLAEDILCLLDGCRRYTLVVSVLVLESQSEHACAANLKIRKYVHATNNDARLSALQSPSQQREIPESNRVSYSICRQRNWLRAK
jgi:hypothetical protein